MMLARTKSLAGQFVFDVQTTSSRRFKHQELFGPRRLRQRALEPADEAGRGVVRSRRYKFQNYMKEIYYDSDTPWRLLSGAPFDDRAGGCWSNEQIAKARRDGQ